MTAARDTRPTTPPGAWLDHAAFYLLLALLGARGMLGEVFDFMDIGFLAALPDVGGPTPATTAWLDTLTLAAGGLVLARWGHCRLRPLVTASFGALLAAVLISSAAAGSAHLALRAGLNLVITLLAGAALICITRTGWMRALVLAVLLATGGTTAFRCLDQEYRELPDTQRFWEEQQKPELIARGVDPEDPLFVNFERRLRASEPHGFLAHPNVTGSVLMMSALITAGILLGLLRSRTSGPQHHTPGQRYAPWGTALLLLLLAWALGLTGSRGAVGAGLIAAGALLLFGVFQPRITRHPRAVLAILIGFYVGVIAVGAAYGLARGTLPHPSLAFRWNYWTAAARAYPDAPVTGLGRENFADAYLHYKPADHSEEVRNPHNLWLSLLVELGPLGLAGGAALCGFVLWRGLHGLAPPPETPPPDRVTPARAVPLAILVLLIQALASGTPFAHPGMAVEWLVTIGVKWAVLFLAALWLLQSLRGAVAAVWLDAGLLAALVAAWIHALLSFALLTPGGLALCVLCVTGLLAAPRALGSATTPSHRPRAAWPTAVAASLFLVAWVAQFYYVTRVVWRAETERARVDEALHRLPQRQDAFAFATAVTTLGTHGPDPAEIRHAARAALAAAELPALPDTAQAEALQLAERLAERACRRNARDYNNHALAARVAEAAARRQAAAGDDGARQSWQVAAERWDRAVLRYPTNPRTRISAAAAWVEVYERTSAADAARAGHAHLRAAEDIDSRRDPDDASRLQPPERERITHLRAALDAAPATAPAP